MKQTLALKKLRKSKATKLEIHLKIEVISHESLVLSYYHSGLVASDE